MVSSGKITTVADLVALKDDELVALIDKHTVAINETAARLSLLKEIRSGREAQRSLDARLTALSADDIAAVSVVSETPIKVG